MKDTSANPSFVLALHKGLEIFGLGLVLCQQQVPSLAVLEIGFQFLCQGRPARQGCAGETSFSRFHSLGTHSSDTTPGSRWLDSDLLAFNNEDGASLTRDMVGCGTADDPATNDQHLNKCCWIEHPSGICFHDVHFSKATRRNPGHTGERFPSEQ
jgi:hypothetical protein